MTLQNAPPGLDYERDKRFSKVVLILSADYKIFTVSVIKTTIESVLVIPF